MVEDTARRPVVDPIAEARRQWVAHGWAEAAPGMAAITSVVRAHQILLGRIDERLRDLDLTFARYELLMLLHFSREGRLPMSVVGDRLQVHPTSVTSAVAKLEEQGFVRREPHPTDGRAKMAALTDDGRAIALAATDRLNRSVFTDPGVDPGEAETIVDVLTTMRRRAGDLGPAG